MAIAVNDQIVSEQRVQTDVESIKQSIVDHLRFTLAKDQYSATARDYYNALVHAIRDRLIAGWIETQQRYYNEDVKRVYYLSLEFLIGRTLGASLINLELYEPCKQAVAELGHNLEALIDLEWDAGLGNGGLGRLAACFLDSMATLGLPGYGYGIRYEYGIFFQRIHNGYQIETPDNWLRYGNDWEIGRPEFLYPVSFHGRTHESLDAEGALRVGWIDTEDVMAMAYDTPIPGYGGRTINTMRLWSAKSSRGFNLDYFNHGDYIRAVEEKNRTENISRILYPNDNNFLGKELRLKQQYFLVSATLQDIIRRYRKFHDDYTAFPKKVAIQLNDTHPSLVVPELMRILVDLEGVPWDRAWDVVVKSCGYTNHTLLPEALETWPVHLLGSLLPRHLQIIFEINRRFLETVSIRYPGDMGRLRRMSLVEEAGEKSVRMANLAIVGSHKVNGVSALHTQLLKDNVFREFHDLYPDRLNNKTNGITPRRWLKQANPGLSALITKRIGSGWITDLDEIEGLAPLADDPEIQASWSRIKRENKSRLADLIQAELGISVSPDALFDCHVKRIHQYKRQLLNVLHAITLYHRIKDDPRGDHVPRMVLFGGKAAPGYYLAKLIIKLINSVADVVNHDSQVGDRLKVVFFPNYRVSLAETIIPAAELSEQISTAGTEASGTGNMKFALNGALTIGTLDGANIEIKDAVGDANIFIFGMTAADIEKLRYAGYDPWHYYHANAELKRTIDAIQSNRFSPHEPDLFRPIVDSLLPWGDHYFHLADFSSYIDCQTRVSRTYRDRTAWARMSILNTAHVGRFSSDRTIREYAREIWDMKI